MVFTPPDHAKAAKGKLFGCFSANRRPMLEDRHTVYEYQAIEKRWQEKWEAEGLYRAPDDDPRPKYYVLEMLPYPSGDLHVGHAKNYT
jgi:valyl-tRNA synthetase